MMKIALLLACHLVLGCYGGDDLRKIFKDWKAKYGKNYEGLRSEIDRYRQFRKSAEQIEHINSIQKNWIAGFTEFADLTGEEKKAFLGLQLNSTSELTEALSDIPEPVRDVSSYPLEKLWEMGPVQSQGSCGSCWSFAAVAAMEGLHIKEHGEYREFSEQVLLDCTFEGGRDGCDGGWMEPAVNWAGYKSPVSKSSHHGYLPIRADRKYQKKDEECNDLKKPLPNALKRAKPYGRSATDRTDEGLLKALATEGPVVVYIFASWQFQFYQFGLYHGMGCAKYPKSNQPNHAVVASGYGHDYFKIKNSWGKLWGRSGYAYFDRSQRNLCAVSSSRKFIDWRPNTHWDICSDTHPTERTVCVDNVVLSEKSCRDRGCCFDATASGVKQCFRKGKIIVYDDEGHRRVLYGSTADFDDLEFASKASSVQVELGKWLIYERKDYSTRGTYQTITRTNGRVHASVQSVKILL